MFAGDMFLPAALMISSFLRSMIFTNPASSICAMSPVCSQPVGVDRLGGLLGLVAVAGHHRVARGPAARRRRRAGSRRPGSAVRRSPAGRRPAAPASRSRSSRTSPRPRRSGSRSRRRTRAPRSGHGAAPIMYHSQRSSPSRSRIFEKTASIGAVVRVRELGGHRLDPAARGGSCAARARSPAWSRCGCASSGSASIPASSAALSFSQIRGTAAAERRMGVGHVREHLRHVGTAGDRVPPDHLRVVAETTVGDVGVRQERDDRAAGPRMADGVDPAALARSRWRGSAGLPSAVRSCPTCRSASGCRPAGPPATALRSRTPGRARRPRARRASSASSAAARRARPGARPHRPAPSPPARGRGTPPRPRTRGCAASPSRNAICSGEEVL